VDRRLTSGVAASNHEHVLPCAKRGLARAGTIIDAGPFQLMLVR
jgi:hypothetical protein